MRRPPARVLALATLLTAGALAGCSASTSGHPAAHAAASSPAVTTTPPVTPSTTTAPSTSASSTHRATPSTRPTPTHTRTSSSPRPTPSPPVPSVSYPAGAGPLVVLNPGHNGGNASHTAEINRQVPAGFGEYKACDTTGTTTDAGYPEHEFNFRVTELIAKVLRAHGVRVVLTRQDDTGVGPCVDQRAEIGNRSDVAAVVSIHADGGPAGGQGFHVNTASRQPDGASARTMRLNQAMAVAIHDALVADSGLVPSTYIGTNGYYRRSDFAGLNLSVRPTTFLELGNMRNAHDAQLQSSTTGRTRIADAVASGILAYLGRHP